MIRVIALDALKICDSSELELYFDELRKSQSGEQMSVRTGRIRRGLTVAG